MYDETFKVIIFGDSNTGKETLCSKFLNRFFTEDSKVTIGVEFFAKGLIVDDHKIMLRIWQFSGKERFRFLLPKYVRGAQGGVFVYDITNYSSIAHIDDWLTMIRKEIRVEDVFPIIVVGNKADLTEYREVSTEDGIKVAKSRGVDGFIECSSKTGENVEKIFQALTELMISRRP